MPSLHRITVDVDGIEVLEARHLRATVSRWLEDDDAHHANVKPFTLTPLHVVDGVTAFDVALLDDARRERIEERAASANTRPIRAGGAHLTVVMTGDGLAAPVVEEASWDALRDCEPTTSMTLAMLTPTVFRSGRHEQLPFPLPGLVFGHQRARWNAFCPPDATIDLDLSELRLHIEGFEGRSETHVDGHRAAGTQGRGPVRDVTFTGFVGTVTYRSHSESSARRGRPLRDWHALARLATYAGTGANTTIGMGVTRIVP
jgi:CRISPR-associated endoribonuclease Cas6